jgi:hypothetical protein
MSEVQSPILTLKVNKFGIEMILNALAQLPYAQSAGLIKELEAQANYQLQQLAAAAQAPAVDAPAQPETATASDVTDAEVK